MWIARKDAEQLAGTDCPLWDTWLQWAEMGHCFTVRRFGVFSLEIWNPIGIYRSGFLYCLLLSATCRYLHSVRSAGVQTRGELEQLHSLSCVMARHLSSKRADAEIKTKSTGTQHFYLIKSEFKSKILKACIPLHNICQVALQHRRRISIDLTIKHLDFVVSLLKNAE